jgi:Zn-finger nucleic acid-binding protein
MTASAAGLCPRCQQPLVGASLGEVTVVVCKTCNGTLLRQLDLLRTLEGLGARLLKKFDPDAKLDAVKDANGRVDCPRCLRTMDRDDYCGAHLVFFDRCNGCALLWFDADELSAMSLMSLRMNARQASYANANPAGPAFLVADRGSLAGAVVDWLTARPSYTWWDW